MARNDEDYDFFGDGQYDDSRSSRRAQNRRPSRRDARTAIRRYKSQQPNVDIVPQTCRCQRTASRRGIGHLGGS